MAGPEPCQKNLDTTCADGIAVGTAQFTRETAKKRG
jgi:hypothetical protein